MRNLLVLSAILSTLTLVFVGCQRSLPTSAVSGKETVTVGILGNNPPLANIGIDMMVEFSDSLGKKTDFNDADDNELINLLKNNVVDIIVSFETVKKDNRLTTAKILESDTDKMFIITRKNDKSFNAEITKFLNDFHEIGEMQRIAKRYISSPNDFMRMLTIPFEFK